MKKNNQGFTLLELVIVTVIIGVLAAIAIPQFNKVLERSRRGACISNMKGMYDQVNFWMTENSMNYAEDNGQKLVDSDYIHDLVHCPYGGDYSVEGWTSNMGISITCPNVGQYSDHVMTYQGD